MSLSKEGMEGVRAVREKIKGKFFSDKLQVGYEKYEPKREIGEEWTDEDGITWVQKNGYYMNKTKLDAAKIPLFCPKCKGNMGGPESSFNEGCYRKYGYCFSCQLRLEKELKRDGKYDDWLREKHYENRMGWLNDVKQEFEEWKEAIKNPIKFVESGEGGVEKWNDSNIDYDSIIKQSEKDIKRLEKEIEKEYKEHK